MKGVMATGRTARKVNMATIGGSVAAGLVVLLMRIVFDVELDEAEVAVAISVLVSVITAIVTKLSGRLAEPRLEDQVITKDGALPIPSGVDMLQLPTGVKVSVNDVINRLPTLPPTPDVFPPGTPGVRRF